MLSESNLRYLNLTRILTWRRGCCDNIKTAPSEWDPIITLHWGWDFWPTPNMNRSYYSGQKNWDRHARQTTGACMLERSRACARWRVAVPIFFGQDSSTNLPDLNPTNLFCLNYHVNQHPLFFFRNCPSLANQFKLQYKTSIPFPFWSCLTKPTHLQKSWLLLLLVLLPRLCRSWMYFLQQYDQNTSALYMYFKNINF